MADTVVLSKMFLGLSLGTAVSGPKCSNWQLSRSFENAKVKFCSRWLRSCQGTLFNFSWAPYSFYLYLVMPVLTTIMYILRYNSSGMMLLLNNKIDPSLEYNNYEQYSFPFIFAWNHSNAISLGRCCPWLHEVMWLILYNWLYFSEDGVMQ